MNWKPAIRPAIASLVVVGLAAAAVVTRDSWLPHVFPSRNGKDAAKPDEHEHPTDRIKLSEQAQANLGLTAGELVPREYWRTIQIPGLVVDRPGESDRGIAARATGIVTEIHAKPGDTVKPGAPLFKLDLVSEYLQAAQVELAKSVTDLALAAIERDRIASLVKLGTAPGADLIRLQNQVDRLTNLAKSLRRQLQLFGLSVEQVARAEQGDVVTEVSIAVPAGESKDAVYEVKDLKVRIGDQVKAGDTLCTLSDHRRLFVEGWAFKSEAKALTDAARQQVKIAVEFTDEHPDDWKKPQTLVIHHLSNQVDPVNRTFPFYLALENESHSIRRDGKELLAWRFRPGQRVRLRVPIERVATKNADGKDVNPFVLPAGAVVREGPDAFVFAQAGDLFIRRPVRVLYEDRDQAAIADDGSITRAMIIVQNQAAAINRAIKAAAGGGGHDHHDH